MTSSFRLKIMILSVVVGVALAGGLYLLQKNAPASGQSEPENGPLIAVTDEPFGGPFTMTDQNGRKVSDKDFSGKYRLIYFGFTYCPAICPTELQKITTTLNALGDKGKEILPMFITVDPDRDTPAKIKSYISLFHPSLVGLSGNAQETAQILKEYKIYANKVQDPNMSEYTMDHSAYVYFIAPDDRLLHIFKTTDTGQTMVDTISAWLAQEPVTKKSQ